MADKKTHPVSESQKRWAFTAEKRGELPKGKAKTWARRAKGKELPEKTTEGGDDNPHMFIEGLVAWAQKGVESPEEAVEMLSSEFPGIVDPEELIAWLDKQPAMGGEGDEEEAPEGLTGEKAAESLASGNRK